MRPRAFDKDEGAPDPGGCGVWTHDSGYLKAAWQAGWLVEGVQNPLTDKWDDMWVTCYREAPPVKIVDEGRALVYWFLPVPGEGSRWVRRLGMDPPLMFVRDGSVLVPRRIPGVVQWLCMEHFGIRSPRRMAM